MSGEPRLGRWVQSFVVNPSAVGNPDESPRGALLNPCACGGVNGFRAEDCARTADELLRDVVLYGRCEDCGAPRRAHVVKSENEHMMTLWCPACGREAD